MQSNNSVSCSYLRFMPKPNGVRTIVNMSRTVSLVQSIFYYSVKLCFRWQKPLRPEEIRRKMFSINSQLSNAFHILRHEKAHGFYPQCLVLFISILKAKSGRSATLFKLDDIHCRIYRFARQWQTCDRKLCQSFSSILAALELNLRVLGLSTLFLWTSGQPLTAFLTTSCLLSCEIYFERF
ncbi:hypothetical protein Zmor_028508 [Zophobas morio]|jgi:hypothetical protein|uniref:Telomerase reverse transcriptase n=1 Tax=Zophobas morio TaxID=2755281 RepID=A0AA38HJ90_9CUCU|nr:hypothetical protein Zmor_028508 [Zophobas morio]